jgi:hypothetical protein
MHGALVIMQSVLGTWFDEKGKVARELIQPSGGPGDEFPIWLTVSTNYYSHVEHTCVEM